MNAIHINWTRPFVNKTNAPYQIEDFEILTTILSALKWREHNGKIKMITDLVGEEYYRKNNLLSIWDDVECVLNDIDVNENVFWAAGKIFALARQTAPVAMIDTDFIVWSKIDEEKLSDVTVIHFEDLYPDVYPPKEHFKMNDYSFDESLDWTQKACNTAFCIIKDNELLKFYTEESIKFMRHAAEEDDRLTYMVFAEQRLLPMCAKRMNKTVSSFSSLERLFQDGENQFTHTWGMKQQMRDNPLLRHDFCMRCINRIIHDYPHMYSTIKNIEALKQYF
jgi:hypothetical protein